MTEKERDEYLELWNYLKPSIVRLCGRLSKGNRIAYDTEDLVQECALYLWQKLSDPKFRKYVQRANNKHAYLFSALKNEAKRDILGRKARRVVTQEASGLDDDSGGDLLDQQLIETDNPEAFLIVEETKKGIREGLIKRMMSAPWKRTKIARLVSRRVVELSQEYEDDTGVPFDDTKGVSQAVGFSPLALYLAGQLSSLYWLADQSGMSLVLTKNDLDVELFDILVDNPVEIGEKWRAHLNRLAALPVDERPQKKGISLEFDQKWLAKEIFGGIPNREVYASLRRIREVTKEVMGIG